MHTAMDKNGTTPDARTGGDQMGASSRSAATGEQHTVSTQVAPQQRGQEGGTAAHTVLSGNSPQQNMGEQQLSSQDPDTAHAASREEAVSSSTGNLEPFSVKFPDNISVSQELLNNYQAFCADCGLSNEQAQQAVDFYLKEQTRQMDAERELSMHILQNGAWKGQFEQRLSVANSAVRALDAQLDGRLQPMLEAGLGNNHVFAEMMACVGDLLQEENFIPHSGGSVTTRSMSTEDFLRNEVFKTR